MARNYWLLAIKTNNQKRITNHQQQEFIVTLFENLETLLVEQKGFAAYITLNRPESRNAMNARMVKELHINSQAGVALSLDMPQNVLVNIPSRIKPTEIANRTSIILL